LRHSVYPKHVRKLYATKKARWSLYRTFRTPELKVKYKSAAERCSQAIMDLTAKKENHLCDNANLGAFYRYVNKKLNGSNGIRPLRNNQGSVVHDTLVKRS